MSGHIPSGESSGRNIRRLIKQHLEEGGVEYYTITTTSGEKYWIAAANIQGTSSQLQLLHIAASNSKSLGVFLELLVPVSRRLLGSC